MPGKNGELVRGGLVIHVGDCLRWLEGFEAGSVGVTIMDPPYSEHVHKNSRRARKLIGKKASAYLSVCLSQPGGRRRNFYVHELVLLAFHGPRPAGFEGCHGDGDSKNNRASNLRWDTPAMNIADRTRHAYERAS